MNSAHHIAVSPPTWRKSSRSANNSHCVEVAVTPDVVGVRDTKDRHGAALAFDRDQWTSFLTAVHRF